MLWLRRAMLGLLARFVAAAGDARLERWFGSGIGQRALFGGMARSFVPAAAGGFSGELEYELSRPATAAPTVRWTLSIDGGRARPRPGAAVRPKLTVQMALPDFLRVAVGSADAVTLVLKGQASVRGDFSLAARLPEMFGAARA
jgi:SCP-2 sterol transfer family